MTRVFMRPEEKAWRRKRKPREVRGRDWHEAAMRNTDSHQKSEYSRKGYPLEPPEGAQP